jgi:hypothetical protein
VPNFGNKKTKQQTLDNFVATAGVGDQHKFEVHIACVIIIRLLHFFFEFSQLYFMKSMHDIKLFKNVSLAKFFSLYIANELIAVTAQRKTSVHISRV